MHPGEVSLLESLSHLISLANELRKYDLNNVGVSELHYQEPDVALDALRLVRDRCNILEDAILSAESKGKGKSAAALDVPPGRSEPAWGVGPQPHTSAVGPSSVNLDVNQTYVSVTDCKADPNQDMSINLKSGDKIQVAMVMDDNVTALGVNLATGANGTFPLSCLALASEWVAPAPAPQPAPATERKHGESSSNPSLLPGKYVVIKSYQASNDIEISLKLGDEVDVASFGDDGRTVFGLHIPTKNEGVFFIDHLKRLPEESQKKASVAALSEIEDERYRFAGERDAHGRRASTPAAVPGSAPDQSNLSSSHPYVARPVEVYIPRESEPVAARPVYVRENSDQGSSRGYPHSASDMTPRISILGRSHSLGVRPPSPRDPNRNIPSTSSSPAPTHLAPPNPTPRGESLNAAIPNGLRQGSGSRRSSNSGGSRYDRDSILALIASFQEDNAAAYKLYVENAGWLKNEGKPVPPSMNMELMKRLTENMAQYNWDVEEQERLLRENAEPAPSTPSTPSTPSRQSVVSSAAPVPLNAQPDFRLPARSASLGLREAGSSSGGKVEQREGGQLSIVTDTGVHVPVIFLDMIVGFVEHIILLICAHPALQKQPRTPSPRKGAREGPQLVSPPTVPPSPASDAAKRKAAEKASSRRATAQKIVDELHYTEENYVRDLQVFVDHIMTPLLADPTFARTDVPHIFKRMPDLLNLSKKLVRQLGVAAERFVTEPEGVANVFLEHVEEWNVYIKYVESYSRAKKTIRKLEETPDATGEAFREFLKRCQRKPECRRNDIHHYLILPIMRISRYWLLLQRLKKYTNQDDPSFEMIEVAEQYMFQIGTVLDHAKRRDDETYRMFEIFREVAGCPANIISFTQRRYISEFPVTDLSFLATSPPGTFPPSPTSPTSLKSPVSSGAVSTASSGAVRSLMIFLFSDCFLLCTVRKPKDVAQGRKYDFVVRVEIDGMEVVENEGDKSLTHDAISIRVHAKIGTTPKDYVFGLADAPSARAFVEAMRKAVSAFDKRKEQMAAQGGGGARAGGAGGGGQQLPQGGYGFEDELSFEELYGK
ncbi:Protein T2 [Borealophlyctis nickersoniae]|nr:Protein T2 [Borealophlyctis nickersoniae]